MIQRTCEQCGATFAAHRYLVAKGYGRYCSRRCTGAALRTTAERFWSRVARGKRSACWLWRGATRGRGYGRVSWGRRTRSAHRVAYELTHGPIPDGKLVCHRCDNPPCCNPAHLYLDTHAGNTADTWARKRGRSGAQVHPERLRRGERHPNAKLTADAVLAIRAQHAVGRATSHLAATYGVSTDAIRAIVSRRLWRHV